MEITEILQVLERTRSSVRATRAMLADREPTPDRLAILADFDREIQALEEAAAILRQVLDQGPIPPEELREMRMGSKGGYVAVSPSPDETVQVTRAGEKTTSKDVTRYLERGHGIPTPSGRSRRYVPRIASRRTYVPGRMFYSWARQDTGKIALEEAHRAMDQLTDIFADYLAED